MVRVVKLKQARRLNLAAVVLQKYYRAHFYSDRLNTIRLGVIYFQASFRGKETRRNVRKILENDPRYMSRRRPVEPAKKAQKKVKLVHDESQRAEKEVKLQEIQEKKEKKAGKLSKLFHSLTDERASNYKSRIPKLWSQDRLLKLFGIKSKG